MSKTKKELQEALDELEITYDDEATNAELEDLLTASKTSEDEGDKPEDEEEKDEATIASEKAIAKEEEKKASITQTPEEEELEKEIAKLQKGKKEGRSEEVKEQIRRLIVKRAEINSANAKKYRDLDELFPSQMTAEELKTYCIINKIVVGKNDSYVVIRQLIREFRSPGLADRNKRLNEIRV